MRDWMWAYKMKERQRARGKEKMLYNCFLPSSPLRPTIINQMCHRTNRFMIILIVRVNDNDDNDDDDDGTSSRGSYLGGTHGISVLVLGPTWTIMTMIPLCFSEEHSKGYDEWDLLCKVVTPIVIMIIICIIQLTPNYSITSDLPSSFIPFLISNQNKKKS